MSFAHLKKKKAPMKETEKPVSSSGANTAVRKAPGGVLSFAHLKGRKPQAAAPKKQPAATLQAKPEKTQPRVFMIPVVMKTARLIAVNYCGGCPRFLPASDWEKERGNPYGRCLRSGTYDYDTVELWKVILGKSHSVTMLLSPSW